MTINIDYEEDLKNMVYAVVARLPLGARGLSGGRDARVLPQRARGAGADARSLLLAVELDQNQVLNTAVPSWG